MTDLLQFLRAILPEQGLKCIVHIMPGQNPRQYFYETYEEQARAILHCDQLGGNVYHGCASYAGRSRAKANVQWVKAFWLDIDVAPKSSYGDAHAAAEAVYAFSVACVGRPPLVVASGHGLHAYWPLQDAVPRDLWEPVALGLKAACETHGLEAGRERTADCASILRPPGAHWRKEDPAIVVEAGPLPEPFAFDDLSAAWGQAAAPAPKKDFSRVAKSEKRGKFGRKALEVVDFDVLADKCAQVGYMRDMRGDLSEPIWHANLMVLAHCANGDEQAHAWSSGHPNYTPAETDAYLERAKEKSGPTTCAHFRNINPDICEGCPHQVKTPLGIATGTPRASGEAKAPVPTPDSPWPQREFGASLLQYREEDGALVLGHETASGQEKVYSVVCAHPVYLESVQRGEIRTHVHGYRFKHWLPQHGWQTVELTAGMARGESVCAVFADAGLNVHDPQAFRAFVALSVDDYNIKSEVMVQFEQYGWKDGNIFLYGDRGYNGGILEGLPGSNELKFRNQWLRPREGGSIHGWKSAADRLFGLGSEGQSFAIIASFAAPLMRFANDSEGGAIVSLVTRASASGKSTALAGAYTVWASDRRALSLTSTDTGNSKGVALATLCNLPAIHDEFEGDPEVTKLFVKLYTEGRDKSRLDRDGQLKHTVGTWQTILFTASNASLADAIGGLDGSDALAYRILEFPVQSGGSFSTAEADKLRKQMELNAGHAGHIYMEYLSRPDVLAWVRERLPAVMEEIIAYGKFGKPHRFWVRTLACVAIAAQIVEYLELVAFSPDRIMKWALDYFAGKEAPVMPGMASWLSTFINQHTAETLSVPGAWKPTASKQFGAITAPARIPNRLTIRREEDTNTYFIAFDVLRTWLIRHDISIHEFGAELEANGVSRGVKSRTLGAGTTLGGGQVKVMEFDGNHPILTGAPRPVAEEKRKGTG